MLSLEVRLFCSYAAVWKNGSALNGNADGDCEWQRDGARRQLTTTTWPTWRLLHRPDPEGMGWRCVVDDLRALTPIARWHSCSQGPVFFQGLWHFRFHCCTSRCVPCSVWCRESIKPSALQWSAVRWSVLPRSGGFAGGGLASGWEEGRGGVVMRRTVMVSFSWVYIVY